MHAILHPKQEETIERKRMQARLPPRKRQDRGFLLRSLLNLSSLPRSLIQPVSARLFRWILSKQASTRERAKLPRTLAESHESSVDREFAAIIKLTTRALIVLLACFNFNFLCYDADAGCLIQQL